MSESCAAIVANFAWFSQTCPSEAVATVEFDGVDWPVCSEHLAAAQS